MTRLETSRLILRQWRLNDVDDLYEYAQNPNIGPNAGWSPHSSKDVSLAILKSFIEQDDVWAVEHRESNKVIGSVGLHADGKRADIAARSIGYALSEEYWGQGLTVEAVRRVLRFGFEEMGLEIVSVFHFPFNIRSKRVIEKCGFKYEGTLRRASKVYNGDVYDDVCYSILKDEYNMPE